MSNRSELFPEASVRRWGRYSGTPTDEQLCRFFIVAPGDFERAARARSTATRLGYAVQLCTVRFLGAFLPDPAQTPSTVVAHVALQMGADPRAWSDYVGSRARLVHQGAIRRDYGYVVFGDGAVHAAFLRWLWGRAWTGDDPPAQLVDLATGWLVEHQVLLPGFSILQRLCASARDRAERRVWRLLARQLS